MTESPVHLRVPPATKGRWIAASRAAGQTLSEYIVNAVEAHMQRQLTTLAIPEDIQFSDLKLARDSDGHVSFDWSVIERICRASGLPVAVLRDGPEDNVAQLLTAWYSSHRAVGGEPDPVYDDLLGEVAAEDAAGQHASHAPGRA